MQNMEILSVLLGISFMLSFLLIILVLVLVFSPRKPKLNKITKRSKVKEDIKKIKEQITEPDDF